MSSPAQPPYRSSAVLICSDFFSFLFLKINKSRKDVYFFQWKISVHFSLVKKWRVMLQTTTTIIMTTLRLPTSRKAANGARPTSCSASIWSTRPRTAHGAAASDLRCALKWANYTVLILDVNSEHIAHAWRKIGRLWLLSFSSNALNRSKHRDCSLPAHLFLSYHLI